MIATYNVNSFILKSLHLDKLEKQSLPWYIFLTWQKTAANKTGNRCNFRKHQYFRKFPFFHQEGSEFYMQIQCICLFAFLYQLLSSTVSWIFRTLTIFVLKVSIHMYLTQGGTWFEHQGTTWWYMMESDMLTSKQQQYTIHVQVASNMQVK